MRNTKVNKPCKECIHCDVENMKCYPESKDCRSEYSLTPYDIEKGTDRCDFFEYKNRRDKNEPW